MILEALNTGMGINAACRVFKVSKSRVYSWGDRLGSLKETLLLYALCHQVLVPLIEGDEGGIRGCTRTSLPMRLKAGRWG